MHIHPDRRPQRRYAILFATGSLAGLVFACSDITGPADGTYTIDLDPPDVSAITYSVTEAMAENQAPHDDAEDHAWDAAEVVTVTLSGATAVVNDARVQVDGGTVTVTAPGTYRLSGNLADGSILVDSDDDGIVRLILDGVDVTSSTNAPIAVLKADETMIVLADNSENHVSDPANYVFADPEDDEPNAALYSKDDLTITGEGSLLVEAHYNDGIGVKDGLVLAGGSITVSAEDDGIRGKDYIVMTGGTLDVVSGGDGLKSDNDDDVDRGYILIEDGTLSVSAGGDGLQAESDLLVAGGRFEITTAGGSTAIISDDDSAKGLKAGVRVVLEGGVFSIDAADDAVHSNAHMVINDGVFDLASGDDAIHADSTLGVNDGTITISRSYEGLESQAVVIAAGTLWITSSDDALNGAGDDTGFGGSNYIYILGGQIAIYASGDGIDVNGSMIMTDGEVVIHGPTRDDNSAIDYQRSFQMTGGFLVAAGSARMAQAPDESSGQFAVLLLSNTTRPAGTLVHIESSSGESVLTFQPSKQFASVAFSSPALRGGATYRVYVGGSHTGTPTDGLYASGSYSGGTEITEFTISNVVTRVSF